MPRPRPPASRRTGRDRPRFDPLHVGDVTIYIRQRDDGAFAVESRSPRGRAGYTRGSIADVFRLVDQLKAEALASAPVTLDDAIDAYLLDLSARGRRASTCGEAEARLRPLTQLVTMVQELRRDHVERRLLGAGRGDPTARRLREKGKELPQPSVATRVGTIARIRDACRYWIARGWLRRDPTEGMTVEGERSEGKVALTPAEAAALAAWLLARDPDDDAALALLLCLWLGLRSGEVRLARVRAVDLSADPPTWHVERSTTKTRRGVRTLALPPLLAARLKARVHERTFDELLFPGPRRRRDEAPGPHDRSWLVNALRRWCPAAGVTLVTPHGLRDTWAQLATTHGAPIDAVSRALGHEDQATTVRAYVSEAVVEATRAATVAQRRRRGGGQSVDDQ